MRFVDKYDFVDFNPTDYIFDGRITATKDGIQLTDPEDLSWPSIRNVYPQWFSLLSNFSVDGLELFKSYSVAGRSGYPTTGVSPTGTEPPTGDPGEDEDSKIRFQFSNNGDTWYYYNKETNRWTDILGETQIENMSNSIQELTPQIMSAFPLQIDGGKLFWRMFLSGDAIVKSLAITGDSYYTTINQLRQFLMPFGIRRKMPGTPRYCEADDFLSDSKLQAYLGIADGYINNITQRDFYYHKDEIEFRDGSGKEVMVTWKWPIRKITKVIMYNPLLQSMRRFVDTELIVDPDRGELFLPPIYPAYLSDAPMRALFGNIWIMGRRNIQIVYDYGYDQPPADIQLAANRYAGIQLMSAYFIFLARGRNSVSFDGYSESFMTGKPLGGLFDQWQKEIDQILARHIRLFPKTIPGVS